ncbi:hypothetical protein D918_08984 [Trichuris suis]|nr:hypothetical protein D918_08984 [Trichuris suis]
MVEALLHIDKELFSPEDATNSLLLGFIREIRLLKEITKNQLLLRRILAYWKSTLLTVVCLAVQLFTFVWCFELWFLFHYIPGGDQAIRLFTSIFGRTVRSNLVAGSSSSSNLPI